MIVRGTGTMTVGEEESVVGEGDLVFIPRGTVHFLRNHEDQLLTYASATSPPQSMAELYRTGLA